MNFFDKNGNPLYGGARTMRQLKNEGGLPGHDRKVIADFAVAFFDEVVQPKREAEARELEAKARREQFKAI